ncbi:MAG: extradiol ring-cleavage dioxygenase [Chloroflexota bacterium]|nr:extradiol ring-cleavage dioxygenase [Chloroflexota bacterium]MDE3193052.1 extradiol ring-cleavage dioxygenase [Chloroflexota bacterium]
MGLVFAAIAPHGGLAVEELVSAEDRDVALATRRGFEELGRRFDAAAPESVVVLTPHGIHVEGAMAVVTSGKLVGELKEGGARQMRFDPSSGQRSITLTVPTDRDLMQRCLDALNRAGVRAVGISYGGNDPATASFPMDWAVLIPLWFMGGRRDRPVSAVSISPARDMSFETHVRAGESLRDVIDAYPKRVALIASCDHGHAHDENGPYGYHPAARRFDSRVVDIVRKNELEKLLAFDAGFVADAKADSFWQMLMLHGALRRDGWRAELLSYEAPTYFGMLCASYVPA